MNLNPRSILICLAILSSAQIDGQIITNPRTQNSEVDEYAIYSAVIKKLYIDSVPEDKRFDLLVIQERTSLQERVVRDFVRVRQVLKNSTGSLDEGTLEDLRLRNKESSQLARLFNIEIPYTVVAKEELTNSFGGSNPVEAWNRFYQTYPNSSGLIGFSRVGFNRGMWIRPWFMWKEVAAPVVRTAASYFCPKTRIIGLCGRLS